MKRILLNLLLLFSACVLHAQAQLTISGTVNTVGTGAPVVNWPVWATVLDPANPTDSLLTFDLLAFTDGNGQYQMSTTVPPGTAFYQVFTPNNGCEDAPSVLSETVSASAGSATVDFTLCEGDGGIEPGCHAFFGVTQALGLSLQFEGFFQADGNEQAQSYTWDFGDGSSGTGQNPTHTYAAEGTYVVTLTVLGSAGCEATVAVPVFVGDDSGNFNCFAGLELQPTATPLQFNFSAQYFSFSNNEAPTAYAWDFGDGSTSTEANPTHTYAQEGFYVVSLTVTGSEGCVASTTHPFSTDWPGFAECFAYISYDQTGETSFDFVGTLYDAAGNLLNPTSYAWDFGDGNTSTNATPMHTYAQEGLYEVTLSTISPAGCEATVSLHISTDFDTVNVACFSFFSVQPTSEPLTFNFEAQYFNFFNNQPAVSYLWNFGDGNTSTEANPTHTYALSGFYVATLLVTGADGCVASSEFPFSTDFPGVPACVGYILYEQTNTTTFDFTAQVYGLDGFNTTLSTYNWDFGDGNTSTEATPTHSYATEGIYNVMLTGQTEDGCEIYACEVVVAHSLPIDTFFYGCQALFAVGPVEDPALGGPLTLKFHDLSLGAVQTWAWDFGDGGTSTEQNPIHTYATEGLYVVTLSITTFDNCQSSIVFVIWAGEQVPWDPEPDCQALFIPIPDSLGSTGLQFIDLSFSPTPISTWEWDFGDGNTSMEQNPFHVYAQPGVYTVTLKIGAEDCNSVISFEIDTESPWNFADGGTQLGRSSASSSTVEQPLFQEALLSPNPVLSELRIAFQAEQAGDYELRVTDLSGKMLLRTQQQAQVGSNALRLPVEQLKPGLYLAELRSGTQTQMLKFVKAGR